VDVRIKTSIRIIIINQSYLRMNERTKERTLTELRVCQDKLQTAKGKKTKGM